MTDKAVSLQSRIESLIKQHDGVRAAGAATGIDPPYLWRLLRGEKTNPSDETLAKLGLRKKVSYVLLR
jgi:transcriptional regulator with XRE-family HTH domain